MPVQLTYPGVYVQEIPSGVTSISGVSTSVGLFIGMAGNGPMMMPTEVLTNTDFESTFGTGTAFGEMPDQVRQFFLNGGQQAWIMRIANNAKTSTLRLKNEFGADVLQLEAKNAGTVGDMLRIVVDYDTPTPEMTFNMRVYRLVPSPGGTMVAADTEIHSDLSMNPNDARNVAGVLRDNSALIAASSPPLALSFFSGFSLGGNVYTGPVPMFTAVKNAAMAAPGNIGSFVIAVDGAAPQLVNLAGGTLSATAGDATVIKNTINLALSPLGKSINLDATLAAGGQQILRFTSTAGDGSVRITSAPGGGDIAATLGWTSDAGALEIGGYANSRPAPSGFFSRLGNASTPLTELLALIATNPKPVTALTLTDVPGNALGTITPIWPPGLSLWNIDSANSTNSFANVKANLATLVGVLNAAFATLPQPRYSASLVGFRVVIKSLPADSDTGPSMSFTTGDATLLAYLNNANANVNAYRVSGPGLLTTVQSGSDGFTPTPGDYANAFAKATTDITDFNIVMLPRAAGQSDNDRANLWGAASSFAKGRRAFLIVDPPSAWKQPADAVAGMPAMRIGMLKDYAAIYWPRISIPDPVTGIQRFIDPSGTMAGIYSRIDAARGVWKAPAGLDSATLGVHGLERRVSDGENGLLNPMALNVLRAFPDGVVSWGARTMDGYDNSGDTDYRYVPVRRTALFIEESLYRGLKFAVFEPNDDRLWARIRLAAGGFMNTLFRKGAFQGLTKDTAYFVICDKTTTTQTDINLGVVNVTVGFAALRPAEFVVLTVQQMAGQIQT